MEYDVLKAAEANRFFITKDKEIHYTLEVDANGNLTCNCPAFRYRSTCKHLQMVKDKYDITNLVTEKRHPREVVSDIVGDISHILDFWSTSQKWSVVGSYRRGKDTIKDIDIVALVTDDDSWELLVDELEKMSYYTRKVRGGEITRGTYRGIPLDINRVMIPSDWVPQLLYRTGSKELNIKMRSKAKQRGWILNEHGLFDEKGNNLSINFNQEKEFFDILEMDYLEPKDR